MTLVQCCTPWTGYSTVSCTVLYIVLAFFFFNQMQNCEMLLLSRLVATDLKVEEGYCLEDALRKSQVTGHKLRSSMAWALQFFNLPVNISSVQW